MVDNKYKNIKYISLLNDVYLLPELNCKNFPDPGRVSIARHIEEWDFWGKYNKKQYVEIINEVCHEGATIKEDQNCHGKLYYTCSICTMQTIGNTIEEAIYLMLERIIAKMTRGETGLC